MKTVRLAQAVGCLIGLAFAGTGLAQDARSRRPPPSLPTMSAHEADSIAYLAGKQPLVGLHAPSSDLVPRDPSGRPMLSLRSVNRGESLAIPALSDNGGFASIDLDRAAHLLRAAGGDEHPIDPRTLGLLYGLQIHFGVPELRVVSGYRLPRPGSRSNHCKGRAVDLIVPGVADEEAARFVRELGFVGVGVYPRSQFVHVDIRPRSYFWIDDSAPHKKNRERGILLGLATSSDAAAIARGQVPVEPFALGTDVEAAVRSLDVAAGPAAPEDEEEEEH